MRVRVGCEFQYEALSTIPAVMLVRARSDGTHRTVYESRWVDPALAIREYRDSFGNICWRLTLTEGHHHAPVRCRRRRRRRAGSHASRHAAHARRRAPRRGARVHAAEQVRGVRHSLERRVAAVRQHAAELGARAGRVRLDPPNIAYKGGSSSPEVTALTVYERRVGVCRDFALLAVAFCRALNIPARYTFGYLPDIAVGVVEGAMDFHAWFEAFIGGRWFTFDARHNVPRIGRVVIGYGRDAADVAMTTSYGPLRLERMTVWADEVQPGSRRGRRRSSSPGTHRLGSGEQRAVTADAVLHARSAIAVPKDWSDVARVCLHVQQEYRYTYSAPVTDIRQRLMMVPPGKFGDQQLRSHELTVEGADDVVMEWENDRFGNRVCKVRASRVRRVGALRRRVRCRALRAAAGAAAARQRRRSIPISRPPRSPRPTIAFAKQARRCSRRSRTRPCPRRSCRSTRTGFANGCSRYSRASGRARRSSISTGRRACRRQRRWRSTSAAACARTTRTSRSPCSARSAFLRATSRVTCSAKARRTRGSRRSSPIPREPSRLIAMAYDPTHHRRPGMSYVTVAVGRDYADVAPTSGSYTGIAGSRLIPKKDAWLVELEQVQE